MAARAARVVSERERRGLAWALPAVLGLLAAGLVLLANATYGPVGEWDSVTSLNQMGRIEAGHLLHSHATPPGYSALSWLLYSVSGLSPILAAGLVSTVAFGLAVSVTTFWLRSAGASNWIVVWCGVVCMLSPLATIAGEVLTDALFVLWVTLTLFWLDRFLVGRGERQRFLALAALAAAAACLTRLVGVAVVASGAIYLLIAAKPAVPCGRRAAVAAFAAAASAPLAAWVFLGDIPLGEDLRHRVDFRLQRDLSTVARTLVEWTFGHNAARMESSAWNQWTGFSSPWLSVLASLGGLMVFVLVLVAPLAAFVRRCPRLLRAVGANGLFLLCYPAALFAMLWFRDLGVSPRYLLPMYMPGVFILAVALQAHGRHVRRLLGRLPGLRAECAEGQPRAIGAAAVATLAGLIVFLAWQSVRLPQIAVDKYQAIKRDLTFGRGLTAKRYGNSKTVRHVAENLSNARLFATNRRSVLLWYLDPLGERLDVRATGEHGDDAAYLLVWFYPHGERYPSWVDVCQEQQRFDAVIAETGLRGLRVVAALDDGIVMRNVKAGESPESPREIRAASSRGFVGGGRPIYESADVAVHLADDVDDRVRVIYSMDALDSGACPCGAFPFFLHVIPVDPDDLPEWRRGDGFDNLDYLFKLQPWRYLNAACGAAIPLPDYAVRRLRTGKSHLAADGQWKNEWSVDVPFADG